MYKKKIVENKLKCLVWYNTHLLSVAYRPHRTTPAMTNNNSNLTGNPSIVNVKLFLCMVFGVVVFMYVHNYASFFLLFLFVVVCFVKSILLWAYLKYLLYMKYEPRFKYYHKSMMAMKTTA